MKPTITLVRAIGTEFVRRSVRPLIILGSIAAVVLLGVGGYLTTLNAWWAVSYTHLTLPTNREV